MKETQSRQEIPPAPPVVISRSTASHRVLVADDKAEMRKLIATVLRKDGYDVSEAADGLDLLAQIELTARTRSAPIGVIISDVRMPGLTGLDLLAILRCASWETPVILITAFGDDATHAQARELGVSAVFDKPFEIDDLRAAVHRLVPPA